MVNDGKVKEFALTRLEHELEQFRSTESIIKKLDGELGAKKQIAKLKATNKNRLDKINQLKTLLGVKDSMNKHLQDSMEMLAMMGITIDNDATEGGALEGDMGNNQDIEKMELEKDPIQAQDSEDVYQTSEGYWFLRENGKLYGPYTSKEKALAKGQVNVKMLDDCNEQIKQLGII